MSGLSKLTEPVCPLSVLSNWEKQVRDHVSPGQLTMYTYHGASRNVTAKTLQDYDVSLQGFIFRQISGQTS
jgi:SWI/SNF-related matrix-associated actin-dependent regulator of chromatin subfamily A3